MSDGCYHYNHAALTAPNTTLWPGGGFIATGYISWMAWDPDQRQRRLRDGLERSAVTESVEVDQRRRDVGAERRDAA